MQETIGIYSLAEAARLIGTQSRTIQRWMFGHAYRSASKDSDASTIKSSPPLWTPQHDGEEGAHKIIGFRDLLELRVVREFVQHGVHLSIIRECLEQAKNILQSDHPFALNRFATDGKTIFTDLVRHGTAPELVDLRNRQLVFRVIIKPSLYDGIEYDNAKRVARRWFPNKQKNVVLDPQINFGKPILIDHGISTEAIYANYLAEGENPAAVKIVARIFEIKSKDVDAAIIFEKNLRLKAA